MAELGSSNGIEFGSSLQEKYDALAAPAIASKRVVDFFNQNPFCDRTVLRSTTNLQAFVENGSEVVHLAGVLLDTRENIRRAYSELSSVTGKNQKKIATVLYEAAQVKSPHEPKGIIKMGYLDNPFALTIIADKTDFAFLDPRDIAGHYNSRLNIGVENKQFTVPFIAIQSGTSLSIDEILNHEKKHGINDMIMRSFLRVNKGYLWGGHLQLYSGENNKIARSLVEAWGQNTQNPDKQAVIKLNPNWRRMMDYSLSYAKDEIIVRFMTGEDTGIVTKDHDMYDLQDSFFHLDKDKGVTPYFRKVFTTLVRQEVESVIKVMRTYSAIGMKEKAEILPWMLQRVPLGDWRTELNKVGISSEVELINAVLKYKKNHRIITKSSAGADRLLNGMLEKQNELLTPQLVEYLQTIQK